MHLNHKHTDSSTWFHAFLSQNENKADEKAAENEKIWIASES